MSRISNRQAFSGSTSLSGPATALLAQGRAAGMREREVSDWSTRCILPCGCEASAAASVAAAVVAVFLSRSRTGFLRAAVIAIAAAGAAFVGKVIALERDTPLFDAQMEALRLRVEQLEKVR